MAVFLQMLMINLVVSCDNVGVIALATKKLPGRQAVKARRIGIFLSLGLKIVFIAMISSLLSVTWLHIRIIGGALLLYVTFQMLEQNNAHQKAEVITDEMYQNSYRGAIIAIIAADISMSFDNIIAIMGLVSADGEPLKIQEYIMVITALVICLPLLLWFSNAIVKLMKQYPVLAYICAGYLAYTAVNIIFEDETIRVLSESMDFVFAKPAAILCGVLMAVYGVLTAKKEVQSGWVKRGKLFLYITILISSLIFVAGMSSFALHVPENVYSIYQIFTKKIQSGINAVYLLGMESEILCFCAVLLAGMIVHGFEKDKDWCGMFWENGKGMLIFALLYLVVTTAGLTYTFGIGEFIPVTWFVNVLLMLGLLCTYPAIFTLIGAVTRNQFLTALLGFFYMFIETVLVAVCTMHPGLQVFAGLFPKYYLSTHVMQPLNLLLIIRITVVCMIYIGIPYWKLRKDKNLT